MNIEIITNLNRLKDIKPHWDRLHSACGASIFIHHSWVFHQYKHFSSDSIITIVIYDNDGTLIGALPLTIQKFRIKSFKFRCLSHACHSLSDYSQFLFDPKHNIRSLMKKAIDTLLNHPHPNWDMLKIDNLSDSDEITKLFRAIISKRTRTHELPTTITPEINFSKSYSDNKVAKNIQRRHNRIAEHTSTVHLSGAEISNNDLAALNQLQQQTFHCAAFGTDDAQRFFTDILNDTSFARHCHFSSVSYKDDIMSAHFGFIDESRYYYYVPAHKPEHNKHGPGQYLLQQLISYAERNGIRRFDFLRGNEDYKFDWANTVNTNYTLIAPRKNISFISKVVLRLWILKKSAAL